MSHNPSRSQDKTHYNSFFVKQIMFIKYRPYKMRHEQNLLTDPKILQCNQKILISIVQQT